MNKSRVTCENYSIQIILFTLLVILLTSVANVLSSAAPVLGALLCLPPVELFCELLLACPDFLMTLGIEIYPVYPNSTKCKSGADPVKRDL